MNIMSQILKMMVLFELMDMASSFADSRNMSTDLTVQRGSLLDVFGWKE